MGSEGKCSCEINFLVKILLMFKVAFNPLSNNKILDMTKLKAFADNRFIVAKMTVSLFDRVENAGCQHCLLFSWCFPKPS